MSRRMRLATAALAVALSAGTARAVDTFTQGHLVFYMQNSADLCNARAAEAGMPAGISKRLKKAAKLFAKAAALAGKSKYPACLDDARAAFARIWPARGNARVGSALYNLGGNLRSGADEFMYCAVRQIQAAHPMDAAAAQTLTGLADAALAKLDWVAAAKGYHSAYVRIAKFVTV